MVTTKHNRSQATAIAAMLLFSGQQLLAEQTMQAMPGMEHGNMQAMPEEQGQAMDHASHAMAMEGMDHGQHSSMQAMPEEPSQAMDHASHSMAMEGTDHGQHGDMQVMPEASGQTMNHTGHSMAMEVMDHGQHGSMQAMPEEPSQAMDHTSHSMAMEGTDHGQHGNMQAMPGETGQGMSQSGHSAAMDGMTHGAMDMGHDNPAQVSGSTVPMTMPGMDHGAMPGGSAVTSTRDPHAYSGGYTLVSGPYAMQGPRQLRLADEKNFGSLLIDKLEAVRTSDNTTAAYDLQAWFGRDYDRAVLRAEGSVDSNVLEEASTELLWGHAVSSYWDTLLGLRYDSGEGPERSWLAFGVQGLAPYWFEVDATAYLGEEGRSAFRLVASYEAQFTQRLILQPGIEANLYGKDDGERGIGSGLADVVAGLRLRYEIHREFAPYIGAEWAGLYGTTADYARDAGLDTSETRAVAGVRFWF